MLIYVEEMIGISLIVGLVIILLGCLQEVVDMEDTELITRLVVTLKMAISGCNN